MGVRMRPAPDHSKRDEWLRDAYEKGRSVAEVAREFGLSCRSVRRILEGAGVRIRSNGSRDLEIAAPMRTGRSGIL
jgi:transposase-like protein